MEWNTHQCGCSWLTTANENIQYKQSLFFYRLEQVTLLKPCYIFMSAQGQIVNAQTIFAPHQSISQILHDNIDF